MPPSREFVMIYFGHLGHHRHRTSFLLIKANKAAIHTPFTFIHCIQTFKLDLNNVGTNV